MTTNTSIRLSIGLALAAALVAVPADAQGKGKAKEKRNDRQEQRASELRRDSQRPELVRRGDAIQIRQRDDRDRRDRANGGPPFCRNGQGHPVHGRRWCEEKGYEVYGSGSVLDSRTTRDRNGDYGRYGSYEEAHSAFHRTHDRQCRERAAERPLDLQWQLRVRNECRDRHEEWHYRAGRSH